MLPSGWFLTAISKKTERGVGAYQSARKHLREICKRIYATKYRTVANRGHRRG